MTGGISMASKWSKSKMDPQKLKEQRKKKFYLEGLIDLDQTENFEELERKMSPAYQAQRYDSFVLNSPMRGITAYSTGSKSDHTGHTEKSIVLP